MVERKKGTKYTVVAIDEAGRGPLAGPIAVAAIAATINFKKQETSYKQIPIFKQITNAKIRNGETLKNIRDSKKLSERQREMWFAILKNNFEYKVAMVGPQIIDKIGIQRATRLALNRALRSVTRGGKIPDIVLLDGLLKAPKCYKQETIIKGDEKVPLISAASIMAKVKRDRKMRKIHESFPEYGFDHHKGYGTKLHYDMIKKHGILACHRNSFLRVCPIKIKFFKKNQDK